MEKNIKELCTIAIGLDRLEDSYTFYNNGMIKRAYDESIFRYGLNTWITPGEIDNSVKRRILKNCPNRWKKSVRQILSFNLKMNRYIKTKCN